MAWQDLQNELPENLIEYIQLKDDPDYAEIAKDAFWALVQSYQKDFLQKLIPICINWGYDKGVAIEIAEKTFDNIWRYPKYNRSKIKQKDSKLAMMFYLYGIAKRELADYKKSELGLGNPFTGDEQIVWEFPDIGALNESVERKAILTDRCELIKKALSRLTPKHKVIYLTYKQYEEELKQGYKMPRKLLAELRSELDLTQNTVKVYKNEAFKVIDEYLNIYGSK